MGTPALAVLSSESVSKLASNHASEKIRSLIKRQVTVSKRERSWFRLNLQERSILDLVLSLKVSFKSLDLMRAVVSVMKKLKQVSSRSFNRFLVRGSQLARYFSDVAVGWGNAAAKNWRTDRNYILFLGQFAQGA